MATRATSTSCPGWPASSSAASTSSRRCRAVTKLGPGGVQNWAGDIIAVLRDAHAAVEAARARGDTALDQKVLDDLRERYDTALRSGIIHNRLRDWDTGNHPGYALGCWLRDYKEQVFLFTRQFAVSWTNYQRARGQGSQEAPGRFRILAQPQHTRPLVPPAQLPRHRRRPRHHRTRRHPRRHRGKALATAAPGHQLTPIHVPP
jgi:hypothetical protein